MINEIRNEEGQNTVKDKKVTSALQILIKNIPKKTLSMDISGPKIDRSPAVSPKHLQELINQIREEKNQENKANCNRPKVILALDKLSKNLEKKKIQQQGEKARENSPTKNTLEVQQTPIVYSPALSSKS